MLELETRAHDRALTILRETIAQIETLPELDNQTFEVERERSLEALRETAANIEKNRPLSEREQLERELRKAVEAEKFERAAELRDRIRVLSDHGKFA
jgi:excinuclease UvrABC helicase subunit UvrB